MGVDSGSDGLLRFAAVSDEPPAGEQGPTHAVAAPLEMLGGVWANAARVTASPYEFTFDFIRRDFSTSDPELGILVQRVSMAPMCVAQFVQTVEEVWNQWQTDHMSQMIESFGQPEDDE